MNVLRTITVGKYISIQGVCVRTLPNGLMEVRVGNRIFSGIPVERAA